MTENEIETLPVRSPSWRDNKAVLWLVRIGFLLQFHIPMVYCCYLASLNRWLISQWAVNTLMLLIVQCAFFTWVFRLKKLCSAHIVLWCLIIMNVIHSAYWLYFALFPLTMYRLALPTALYFIAILVEWIVFFRKRKSSVVPKPASRTLG